MVPLMVAPFPNIPLYYAGEADGWSHCTMLKHVFIGVGKLFCWRFRSSPTCAGYKAYSHNKALKGCRKLLASVQSGSGVTHGSAGATASQAAPAGAITADTSKWQSAGSRPDAAGEGASTTGKTPGNAHEPALIQLMSNDELAEIVQAHHR